MERGEANSTALLQGLASIDGMASLMAAQIESVLDVTQLRMGKPLDLDRRETDLVALARRAADQHQTTTERHRIVVDAGDQQLKGRWDGRRLERVLGNILTNAIKYSPEAGEIVVTLSREADASGTWAVLSVRDHGIGIPAADLPHILDQFHRAGNVGAISGSGMGLAAARDVVEQHGGRIEVESQEGDGSIFTIRLPV